MTRDIKVFILKRVLLTLSFMSATTTVLAAEPIDAQVQEKGLSIAAEAERRDSGWGDSSAEMSMHLANKHGASSSRQQ